MLVSDEMTKADAGEGRNAEVLALRGAQICRVEVDFGWDLR